MQAQSIPTSINAASAAPAAARGPGGDVPADATTPFAEALSREIGQRQQPGRSAADAAGQDLPPGAVTKSAAQALDAGADAAEEAALAAEASAIAPVTDMLALAATLAQPAKMGTDPISDTSKTQMGTDPISAAASKMGTDPISDMSKMGSVPISSISKMGSVPISGTDVPAQNASVELRADSAAPASPAAAIFAQALVQGVQNVGTGATARTEAEGAAQPSSDLLADVAAQPAPGRPAAALAPQAAAAQAAEPQRELAPLAASSGEAVAEPVAAEAPAPAEAFATQLQATRTEQVQASAMAGGERLAARVGTPAWDRQLGQKIVFMAAGAEQSASLMLNPPDLGPVQVVLNISNDQASVAFSSQQLEVRQALENAMPKLREMMGESGITLGSATVNAGMPEQQQQAQRGQDARAGGHNGNGRGNGGGANGDDATPAAPVRRVSNGVVDTFA